MIERALNGGIALLDPPAVEFIPDARPGGLHDHPCLFRQRLVLYQQTDVLGDALDGLQEVQDDDVLASAILADLVEARLDQPSVGRLGAGETHGPVLAPKHALRQGLAYELAQGG